MKWLWGREKVVVSEEENKRLSAELEQLKIQTKTVLEQQERFVKFANDYTEKITSVLKTIEKLGIRNADWAKEFHRLLINEYAQYPTRRVYGVIYARKDDKAVKRLMLVSADKLEKVQMIGEEMLKREQENPDEWIMEAHQSIDLPDINDDPIQKVDRQLVESAKPLGVFINDLHLIKDRFATTPTEKATLTKLITKINDKYGTE